MNRLFNFNQKISIRIPILVSIACLSLISLLVLKTAGNFNREIFGFTFSRAQQQVLWILIGSFFFFLVQFVRLRFFHEKMYYLYSFFILMITLPFFSEATKGAQNWFLGFQPSEIGKIVIVIALAKVLSDNKKHINNIFFLILSMLLIVVPILVFIIQRDLGAVLVYSFIFIPMVYWMNIRTSSIFFLISPIFTAYTILSIQIYNYYQSFSKFPYVILSVLLILNFILLLKFISNQKITNRYKIFFIAFYIIVNFSTALISNISWGYLESSTSARLIDLRGRIENFIIPSLNPNAGGWQIKQSMVAVGAGGFFGVGLGQGTQVNLQFLPEADTDFIISSIAEALGFIFIFLIICIYMYLFYWLLIYAQYCSSNFLSLLIIGYSSILFAHIVITLGMAVALAPITGIPAPFLSYGGSFTLACFIILGICNNAANND